MRPLLVWTVAALALTTGVARLWPDLRGCEGPACVIGRLLLVGLATGGAWVGLLLLDYLLHHARLVFVLALLAIVGLAVVAPVFSIGAGLALVLLTTAAASGGDDERTPSAAA